MWLPLLFFAVTATLPAEAELANRRDENLMLHQRLNLSRLRMWDRAAEEWRAMGNAEQPAGVVMVVHLWADYCKPCIDEFPWLKSITAKLGSDEIRFVFVAESPTGSREMRAFLLEHGATLPAGPIYQDTGGALLQGLAVRRLPMTLLLDAEGGVRQVFLGSIRERRGELVDSLLRLQRHLRPRVGETGLGQRKAER